MNQLKNRVELAGVGDVLVVSGYKHIRFVYLLSFLCFLCFRLVSALFCVSVMNYPEVAFWFRPSSSALYLSSISIRLSFSSHNLHLMLYESSVTFWSG